MKSKINDFLHKIIVFQRKLPVFGQFWVFFDRINFFLFKDQMSPIGSPKENRVSLLFKWIFGVVFINGFLMYLLIISSLVVIGSSLPLAVHIVLPFALGLARFLFLDALKDMRKAVIGK